MSRSDDVVVCVLGLFEQLEAVLKAFAVRTVIWAQRRGDWAERFDHVLVMQRGQVVEQGASDALNRDGSALHELVAAE